MSVFIDGDLYPVTIIAARYGGSYENGRWCAFGCHPNEVPEDATGNDITAANFWWGERADRVGRGLTPDAALADLVKRVTS